MARRIHLILGIVLALFLAVEALSGSALLYQDRLDRIATPALHSVRNCAADLPIDVLARRARSVLPGRVTAIDWDLDGAPDTIRFTALDARGSKIEAYLDPCDARVAGIRPWSTTVSGFATELHATLLLGTSGHAVVLLLGLLTCVLVVAGVVLWPGWRNLRFGFRFRRKVALFGRLRDLHVSVGIIIALGVFVLGLTGAVMAESDAIQAVLVPAHVTPPVVVASRRSHAVHYPMQFALDTIRVRFPLARTTEIALDAATSTPLVLYVRQAREADEFGSTIVYADPSSGALLNVDDAARAPAVARVMNAMLPLHMGTPYRFDLRFLVLTLAVVTVISITTGVWMRVLRLRA